MTKPRIYVLKHKYQTVVLISLHVLAEFMIFGHFSENTNYNTKTFFSLIVSG